jgi:hypothetical protein
VKILSKKEIGIIFLFLAIILACVLARNILLYIFKVSKQNKTNFNNAARKLLPFEANKTFKLSPLFHFIFEVMFIYSKVIK